MVEDEKEEAGNMLDLNEEAGSSIVFPSVFTHGGMPIFAEVLQRDARIRDRPMHKALKMIWLSIYGKSLGDDRLYSRLDLCIAKHVLYILIILCWHLLFIMDPFEFVFLYLYMATGKQNFILIHATYRSQSWSTSIDPTKQ